MADNSVTVSLELVDKISKQLDGITGRIDKLEETSSKGFAKAGSAFKVFEGVLSADLAIKALDKITGAASDLFKLFVTDGVKAASEQEDAINSLNVALAAGGNYSAKASQQLQDFASSLQETTKFSDDAVLSSSALLGSMTNLDVNGLQRATKAAVNLSAALGIDLDSATRIVGKASEGNTEALKKYGIEAKKGATSAQTLESVLSTLESRFGNAATGQVNTYSGAVTLARNQFGELQETTGNVVVGNLALIGSIKELGKIFHDMNAAVAGNSTALQKLMSEGLIGTVIAMDLLVASADKTARGLQIVYQAAMMVSEASAGFGALAAERMKEIGRLTEQQTSTADSLRSTLDRLKKAAEEGYASMLNGATASVAPINSSKEATERLTEAQKKQIEAGEKLIEQNTRKALSTEEALAADLAAVNAAEAQKLATMKLTEDERFAIQSEALAARQQLYTDANTKEIEELQAKNAILAEERTFDAQAQIEQNNAVIAAKTAGLEKGSLKAQEIGKKQADFEKRLNTERLQATAGIFGNINTLAQAAGKDGFEIAKVAGIAQAGALGILAVQQALASAPPPFNFALAATVGAVAALNVAKIASSQPPSFASGLENVPAGFEGDNFPAYLQTNEAVLNRGDNSKLARIADESDGSRAVLSKILSVLERGQTIMIDGREVFSVLRDQQAGGRVFA